MGEQKYDTAAIINNNMSLTSDYFSLNWSHYFFFYERSIFCVFGERQCLSRCLIICFISHLNMHRKCFSSWILCFHMADGWISDPSQWSSVFWVSCFIACATSVHCSYQTIHWSSVAGHRLSSAATFMLHVILPECASWLNAEWVMIESCERASLVYSHLFRPAL